MSSLGEMRVKYAADMSDLMSSQAIVDKSLKGIGDTGNQVSARLQSAYAKVGEATKKVELAQTQAALAMQKAQTAAHDDSLSMEQVQVAMAKADVASERITTSQAQVAMAMERADTVARNLATAETQVAETSERAGMSLRESFSGGLNRVSEAGSGFIGRMRGMGGSLLDFGSKLGMTLFSLQMFTQIAEQVGQALIGQDASMEQTTVAFTGLLHGAKAAHDELANIQTLADQTPFEFPDIASAERKLLAFNFSLRDTHPLITDISDMLSAMGNTSAASLDQIVEVFGQINAAGRLQTQDLQQLQSVGVDAFRLIAEAMHKPEATIRDMVTNGLIPADEGIKILEAGIHKAFGGESAKQAETFNGKVSTIKDAIGRAWQAFTGTGFQEAKGALGEIGNLIKGKDFQDFAKTMGDKVGGAFKAVGETVGAVVKAFKSPEFAKLGDTLGRIFGPLIAAIEGPFKSAMQTISGTKTTDITNSLRQAAIAANDFLTALEGFQGGSSQFAQAGTSVRDTVIQIGDAALQAWGVMQDIGGFLADTFTPVWQQLGQTINGQIIPSWQNLDNSLRPLLPTFQWIAEDVGVVVVAAFMAWMSVLSKVWTFIISAFGGIVQVISGSLQFLAGGIALFADFFSGHFEKMGTDVQVIMNGIINIIKGALNVINSISGGALGALAGMFGINFGKITASSSSNMDTTNKNVSRSANDMKNNVVQAMDDMRKRTIEKGAQTTTGLQNLFQTLQDNAAAAFSQMSDDAYAYLQNVENYVNQAQNDAARHQLGPGGASIYNKNFNGYAEGGDVPRTGVYTVGERGPEKVVLPGGAHVYPHGMGPSGYSSSAMAMVPAPPVIHVHNHNQVIIDGQEMGEYSGSHQARMVRLHQARRTV